MNNLITKKDLFEVVTILQKDLRENFATKKDLSELGISLQNYLKDNFVTKKDLSDNFATKKDLNDNFLTKKDFIEILDDRLAKERIITDEKFEAVDGNFREVIRMVSDGFEDLQHSIDKLEGNHDRRITTVEDKVRVIKNVMEKDLSVKVVW